MQLKLSELLLSLAACLFLTLSANAQGDGDTLHHQHPIDHCGDEHEAKIVSKSNAKADPPITVRLKWPLRMRSGLTDPSYFYISRYIDHDPDEDELQDYTGGKHTYDGHQGTDIVIAPYAWRKVQNDDVEVIAAAPGTIEKHDDGNIDNFCDWDDKAISNKIYIRHDDGTLALYKHMKNDSLTSKKVGDKVKTGEYLGVVASSGKSTVPHLHFEIHSASGKVIDPWKGDYNKTSEGLWSSQLAYLPSKLLYLAISDEATEFISSNCPDVENSHERYSYHLGSTVHFTSIYRHTKDGQVSKFRILKPDNTVWKSWESEHPKNDKLGFKPNKFTLPSTIDSYGAWTYEVEYQGRKHTKKFTVNPYWNPIGGSDQFNFKIVQASPNPAASELTLTLQNVSGPVNITLYNAVGEELDSFQEEVNAETLNVPLDKVPSGFVILKITGEGFSESVKIKKE